MKDEIKQLLPEWYEDEHVLVLSNDIDSLASCAVLKKVKGWEIKYFYDFDKVYRVKGYTEDIERCWIDVAVKSGHAFDNHVSKLTLMDDWNDEMINLNQNLWITNENYGDKYSGSTLLQVWSLYDLPLPQTEKGKMLLLTIDVAFKGFYLDNFHDVQKYYLSNALEFQELYNVIKRHTKAEFYELIKEYRLNEDIVWNQGNLDSKLKLKAISDLLELDIQIPEETFEIIEELDVIEEDLQQYHKCIDDVSINVKTLAFTYKNKMRYSKVHQEVKSHNIFLDLVRRTNSVRM